MEYREKYYIDLETGFQIEERINYYCYQAMYNLAMIYYFDFNNLEKAEFHLRKAAFNEFPYAQNNFGLFYQYHLNQIEKARYNYQRSSQNNFDLAHFNLARLYELEDKKEDSIKHYNETLKCKNELMIFRGKVFYDKRIELSRVIINCYTNLKIMVYNMPENQKYKQILGHFLDSNLIEAVFRPLFKLLFQSNSKSYRFVIKENFSNLKNFFLQFPLFSFDDSCNQSMQKDWEILKQDASSKSQIIKIIIQYEVDIKKSMKNKFNKSIELSEETDLLNPINSSLYEQIKTIFNELNERENAFDFIEKDELNENSKINEIRFISKQDKIIRSIYFPECFIRSFLRQNINETIDLFAEKYFSKPYFVLFGRIPQKKKKKIMQ